MTEDQDNSPLGDMAGKPFKDDGGPAFPVPEASMNNVEFGMSLRDWYAGMALQGVMAYGLGEIVFDDYEKNPTRKDEHNEIAKYCYGLADAMLKARKT